MDGRSHNTSAITLAIIIVAILILGAAGMWYYAHHSTVANQAEVNPGSIATTSMPVSPSPTSTALSLTTLVSTTGWKEYANVKPGFSIEYPPTWTYQPETFPEYQGIIDFQGPEGSLRVDWNFDRGGGPCLTPVVEMPTGAGIFTACQTV
jgi:hypothetical protein